MRAIIRCWLAGAFLAVLALPALAQAQYDYIDNGDSTCTITKYTGDGGDVSIPGMIDGLAVTGLGDTVVPYGRNVTSVTIPGSVTSIGANAFCGCGESLTNVLIGCNVTNIGNDAFFRCSGLTDVTIPDSVISIGNEAFILCRNLVTVKIGSNVTSLGEQAFACTSLGSVTIPASVTSIGKRVFCWPYGLLAAITVDTSNPAYSSLDGVLFNKNQTMLITCPSGKAGNYTTPPNVTSIGYEAFYGCANLTNVTLSASVTNIEDGAFHDCSGLSSVTIPDSVISIGEEAFMYCGHMTSLTIGSGVTFIGNSSFLCCEGLARVTIPAKVKTIGGYAYYDCENLTSIYFLGNAPSLVGSDWFDGDSATVYYLPGSTNWGATFGDLSTAIWNPQVPSDPTFGVRSNCFGFTLTNAGSPTVVVEACTNLANPVWQATGITTLTGGASYFSDPDWMNHPARFYRFRMP